MTIKSISAVCTGLSNILNITVSTSHSSPVSTCTLVCEGHSVTLGDKIDVYLGFSPSPVKVFSGYAKEITRSIPEDSYTIILNDVLVRASDYFFAPLNPDQPFTRSNISGEFLIRDVLAEAGLTNYGYDQTFFTFGINSPVEVKLVSAYDFISSITNLLAFHVYADQNDKVWFVRRLPYITGTDTSNNTLNHSSTGFLSSSYSVNEKALRNRVVVYGANGVFAEASTPSPYLPSGFYKSVVYSSSMLVQTQGMAQDIANYNLDVLNRLTYRLSLTVEGRPDIFARQVLTVTDPFQGISNQLWYAFAVEHTFSQSDGYTTTLELRR